MNLLLLLSQISKSLVLVRIAEYKEKFLDKLGIFPETLAYWCYLILCS